MKNKQYQLSEFKLYDGDAFITFNLIDINTKKQEITLAITDRGRISVQTLHLFEDKGRYYFEYGAMFEQINVTDFEEVES